MDSNPTFEKALEIWKRVVTSEEKTPFALEIDIHKRLLDLFHVGPYYYYIFNCGTGEFEYLDSNATKITGYSNEELSPRFLLSKVHPEDVSYVFEFENAITTFYEELPIALKLSYKTSYDYRIRNNEGQYIRVLQQVTAIQVGEDGSVFRTLGIHTNISHLKPEGIPVLNVMGLNGAPSCKDIISKSDFEEVKPVLTKRELEIVQMIAEGLSTAKIAQSLHLSAHTVKTHRRNIMKKTETHSPADLVRVSITNGWI